LKEGENVRDGPLKEDEGHLDGSKQLGLKRDAIFDHLSTCHIVIFGPLERLEREPDHGGRGQMLRALRERILVTVVNWFGDPSWKLGGLECDCLFEKGPDGILKGN